MPYNRQDMKKVFLLFTIILCCSGRINAQVSINNASFVYGQNFNTLNTSSNIGYTINLPNWHIYEFGSSTMASDDYRGGNGSDPTEDIYSFGFTGSNERALGSIASPGLQAHYGLS